jgi:hypothetical protein
MAETNLADVLLLLTKVSNKLNDRTVELQETINKTVGTSVDLAKSKPEKIVEESKPVIVTDFGVKAEQDLRDNLVTPTEDKEPGDDEKTPGFLRKILGPGLLILGGLAALVTGILSDGPLKGALKIISKVGLEFGIKSFTKTFGAVVKSATGFLADTAKFLLAPFKNIAGKGGGKALFGTLGKLFTKFLTPVIKRIPGIGSLISWGFAVSRFKKGDLVGGLIDVASGIATLFPGIGTGIGIGLDVLNAFLDLKKDPEKVEGTGEGFNLGEFFSKIKDTIMNNFPIKNLVNFYTGAGNVVKGNFKEGFKQMAFAIPFFKPLSEFIFGTAEESKDESGKLDFKKFFGSIKDKILNSILKILPEKILGVSVRARAAKMLGIDMGEVQDDLPAGYKEGDITPQEVKKYKDETEGMSAGEINEYIRTQRKELKENENENSLDKNTFTDATKSTIQISAKQNTLLERNNILLTEILQKINSGSTIVNTTNNNSVSQSYDNSSIRQFRERYA